MVAHEDVPWQRSIAEEVQLRAASRPVYAARHEPAAARARRSATATASRAATIIAPARRPTVPDRSPTAWSLADEMMQGAADLLREDGPEGAFWQVYASDPDDEQCVPETTRERLFQATAAATVRRRIAAGFSGLAGYSCLDRDETRIIVEVLDTRTGTGTMLVRPFRRTCFGRYRMSARAEIRGPAGI